MTSSLAAAVALHTGKIIKKWPLCFWKSRKFSTEWYTTLCL